MTRGGYILIIALILSLFGWREYSHYKELSSMKESVSSLKDFFSGELHSHKSGAILVAYEVKQMKQQLVSSQEQLESFKEQYKGLDEISGIIKHEIESNISNISLTLNPSDSVPVKFTDSLVPINLVNKYYIPKNSKAVFHDEWIDMAFTVSDDLLVDSISVRNKVDVVLGYKKPDKPFKFLRKSQPVVQLQSYSPYTKIVYMNNLVVKDDRSKIGKVLNSKGATFVLGLAAGIAITKI